MNCSHFGSRRRKKDRLSSAFAVAGAAMLALAFATAPAASQGKQPDGQLEISVGASPGGTPDVIMRTVAKIMTEEPFGPLAPIVTFKSFDEVVERANSLPFGLAAYAFTSSNSTAAAIGDAMQSGMVSR